MDLTPRESESEVRELRAASGRRKRLAVGVVIAALVLATGFIVLRGLTNATLFFRNVDEAVAERDDLGDRRFRLQGRVIPESVQNEGGVTVFQVVHACEVATVQHTTNPPELFESPWIPVVLEGNWVDGANDTLGGPRDFYFVSDRMLVKHTNEYAADYGERVSTEPPDGFLDDCSFSLDGESASQ